MHICWVEIYPQGPNDTVHTFLHRSEGLLHTPSLAACVYFSTTEIDKPSSFLQKVCISMWNQRAFLDLSSLGSAGLTGVGGITRAD